ncbi:MAG: hypothetical protein JNL80_01630 [Phycisphaerae bacterium]|nr:hypothetical protein [Phycisphaerae bacterium]
MRNNCMCHEGTCQAPCRPVGWLAAVIAGSVVASCGAADTLFGITNKDLDNRASLVAIDTETGATRLFRTIEIPGNLVPESMTFHRRLGEFIIVLSGSDFHSPYALLRLDPLNGAMSIEPVSGFPADQQKLHGIEYRNDNDTLVISFGATEIHLEDRIAEVSVYGEALAFSPSLGVGDIDYLAWPDSAGNLILSDPNGHNGFARLLSVSDPFGSPHFSLYADTPWQAAIGDPAVDPATLSMYAIQYNDVGGALLELVDSEYVQKGAFGAAEQVVGIAFANVTCPGDFDGDGFIDAADMAILLGAWSSIGGDLNGDKITNSVDLAILLGAWGPCQGGMPPS